MAGFVTGGKVWIVPSAEAPSGKIFTVQSFVKSTLLLYILLGISFASIVVLSTIVNLLTPNVDNYINFTTQDGGIKLVESPTFWSSIHINPGLITVLLLPIALTCVIMGVSVVLSKMKKFRYEPFVLYGTVIASAITLLLGAFVISSQYNFSQPTNATTDDVYMWLIDRYNVLPTDSLPSLEQLMSGQQIMQHKGVSSDYQGIHLQNVNDAYYLFNTEGKEVPLASVK